MFPLSEKAADKNPALVLRLGRLGSAALSTLPLTFLAGLPFFSKLPADAGAVERLGAGLAWLSTAAMLNAALGLLLVLPIALSRNRWVLRYVPPIGFGLLASLMLADYLVLKWYGNHLNQAILQDLLATGVGDSVTLGWGTMSTALAIILGFILTAFIAQGLAGMLLDRRPVMARRVAVALSAALRSLAQLRADRLGQLRAAFF